MVTYASICLPKKRATTYSHIPLLTYPHLISLTTFSHHPSMCLYVVVVFSIYLNEIILIPLAMGVFLCVDIKRELGPVRLIVESASFPSLAREVLIR